VARRVHTYNAMSYSGPERASPRALADCPVRLWGAPELAEASCVNVSRGGMALSLAEMLPIGTLLRISALFSDEEQVDATAVVVWERGYGIEHRIGVRFLSLSQNALSVLANYISEAVAA